MPFVCPLTLSCSHVSVGPVTQFLSFGRVPSISSIKITHCRVVRNNLDVVIENPYSIENIMEKHNKKRDAVSRRQLENHTPIKLFYDMGLVERKPVFGDLQTTQAQTSLRICAV